MEMERCLLHEKDFPKKLWAEAAKMQYFVEYASFKSYA